MLNDCLVTLSFHVIVMGLCVTLVKVCCITDMRVLHWLINSLFPNVWINHFPNTTYETSEPFLQHCLGLRGLYNMLSLPKSAILSPFLSEVLGYYDPITNTFDIRGHVLGITLEDVLFLARIRIDGKPVLVKDYRNNHCSAIFEEVIYDVNKLYEIIEDTSADWKKRKAALLMVIVQCIIILSPNGINFYPPLFEVLSDPDGTFGTYAWGAAMLAFLQHHLEKLNQSTKLGGCTWLLVIPKLWDSLGLTSVREEMEAGQLDQHPFPMQWILEKLLLNSALGNDRRSDYRKKMHTVFENLEDEEICWTPYANWVLPDELKEDKWAQEANKFKEMQNQEIEKYFFHFRAQEATKFKEMQNQEIEKYFFHFGAQEATKFKEMQNQGIEKYFFHFRAQEATKLKRDKLVSPDLKDVPAQSMKETTAVNGPSTGSYPEATKFKEMQNQGIEKYFFHFRAQEATKLKEMQNQEIEKYLVEREQLEQIHIA
uniref:Aminotransferase-like plant mobile domain-containing protein n=1 Tax=Chenopodium quinoa TaxID=63459 RepID=A0A803LPL0_CHEQI